MTTPACPSFGEREEAVLFVSAKDYNKKISDDIFNYYRCSRSGLIFLDPLPADLGRYYPASY